MTQQGTGRRQGFNICLPVTAAAETGTSRQYDELVYCSSNPRSDEEEGRITVGGYWVEGRIPGASIISEE